MSWSAVITGAAALGVGALSSRGASDAAAAQGQSSEAAIEEQRRQFDLLLSLTAPQRQFGNEAINELSRLFGFSTEPQNDLASAPQNALSGFQQGQLPAFLRNNPAFANFFPAGTGPEPRGEEPVGLDVFQASPDFEFRRDQGLEGIAQTLGAAGAGAFSGNALRSLNTFNSNLASGEFSDFINRRMAAAGLGQSASSQAGLGALATGANVGNALINQGDARASGILGSTAAINNTIKDLIDIIAGRIE